MSAEGVPGNGDFEFTNPSGIAHLGSSRYVVDRGQDEVEVLASDGSTFSFGRAGSEDGQFSQPQGIASDAANQTVFVADTENHRIQRFSQNGAFEITWGTFGSGVSQFRSPQGVDLDGSVVYVADTGNNLIKRYTRNGTFLSQFGGNGAGEGDFDGPTDVATFRDRDLGLRAYVADSGNNRIQIFDADDEFISSFGRPGSGPGEFNGPVGVAVGPSGSVYVTDSGNHRVQKFTADGQFLGAVGSFGSAVGQLNRPHGISISLLEEIDVVDEGNDRIQRFRAVESDR